MGPLGQFSHECYEAAVMYAQDKGYHVQLPIRGIIRGVDMKVIVLNGI